MNINEQVKNILQELSGVHIIENNSRLQEDLGLDSLLMVMLLIEIEEKFGIQLDESDMNPFSLDTVQSVVNMVGNYKGEGNE